MSRNIEVGFIDSEEDNVTSREGRVSRNANVNLTGTQQIGHVPRGTCE